MTIKDIIAADIAAIFGVEDNTPLSVQAIYTAPGGIAEDAITGFFSNEPLHGDEQQRYPVTEEMIAFIAPTSSVSAWVDNGTVLINSFSYEIAIYPYPKDGYWSVIWLRTPNNNRTLI